MEPRLAKAPGGDALVSDPRLPIDLDDPAMRSALIRLGWQPPEDLGPAWRPVKLGTARWQAARYLKFPGRSERIFDCACDPLEGAGSAKKARIFDTQFDCQLRCDELNRRRLIGAARQ